MVSVTEREEAKRDDSALASDLAAEIRRTIAQRPAAIALAAPLRQATRATDRALDEAERHVVPSVSPGASWRRLKELLLRVLRVATRSQGTYNARMLEGVRDLEASVSERVEEMTKENMASHRKIVELEREMGLLHTRIAAAETLAPAAVRAVPAAPALPEGFYARFAERFRGSEEEIVRRQATYADAFDALPGPVLDCGCGRGEFLLLLKQRGIESEGVDSNSIAVSLARQKGLNATHGDVFEFLSRRRNFLGGIAAIQFVEHFTPEEVFDFLRLSTAALVPGGLLMIETINPDSLYAMRAFRLDPSHRWPVAAQTLELMVREAGLVEPRVVPMAPVPDSERLAENGENDRKVNRWLFGFQDYALFARKPL